MHVWYMQISSVPLAFEGITILALESKYLLPHALTTSTSPFLRLHNNTPLEICCLSTTCSTEVNVKDFESVER